MVFVKSSGCLPLHQAIKSQFPYSDRRYKNPTEKVNTRIAFLDFTGVLLLNTTVVSQVSLGPMITCEVFAKRKDVPVVRDTLGSILPRPSSV